MGFCRKKPVVIEAMQLAGSTPTELRSALMGAAEWCGSVAYGNGIDIETLEGTMHADIGDWIIKDVKGEFYPCKPDVFEATYEPTDAPHPAAAKER